MAKHIARAQRADRRTMLRKLRAFYVVGWAQYEGTAKFHLFRDCRHLTRKRTECGWDRTGVTHEDDYRVAPHQICKICKRRILALDAAAKRASVPAANAGPETGKGFRWVRVGEIVCEGDENETIRGWKPVRPSQIGFRRLADDPEIRRRRKRRLSKNAIIPR